MSLPAQYNDNEYKNWVRACLGLKFVKEGLVDYVDNEVQAFHRDILVNVCGSTTCNGCTTDDLTRRPRPRPCPKNACDKIRDRIQAEFRYRRPHWENTDATKWCTDHWEIAKCFMSIGSKAVTSPADTDLTGILSICINGRFMPMARQIIPAQHQPPVDTFHKNREARNTILHSGSMSLSDTERQDYIQDMITLLANYKHPVDNVTQDAIYKLRQLNSGIFITPTDELTALKYKLDVIDSSQRDIEGKVDIVQQQQQHLCTKQQDMERSVDTIQKQTGMNYRDLGTKINTVQHEQGLTNMNQRDLQNKVDGIEQKVETNQRYVDSIQQRVDFTQSNQDTIKQYLETKVETIYQRLDVSQHDIDNRIDTIEQRVDADRKCLETKLKDMQQQHDSSRQEIEAIQQEQEQDRVDIKSIEERNQKNGESLLVLNEKLMRFQLETGDDIRDIKQHFFSLVHRYDALHKLITNLSTLVETIEGNVVNQRSQIDDIQYHVMNQETRMSHLENINDIQKVRTKELNDRVKDQESITHEITGWMGNHGDRVKQLEDASDILVKSAGTRECRVSNIEAHTAKQDSRLNDIETRTSILEANTETMQTTVRNVINMDYPGAEKTDIDDRQTSMKVIQNYLLAKYKEEFKTIPMPPLLQRIKVNIDDVYTELVIRDDLVYTTKKQTDGDTKLVSTSDEYSEKPKWGYEPTSDLLMGVHSNKSIMGERVTNYTDILHNGKESFKKIFVIGKAGIGKTTWSRKLISTWCGAMSQSISDTTSDANEAALRKYDLVFYLELRNAKSVSHIMEMIQDQLFSQEPALMRNVESLLKSEQYSSRCLIVLDGLDEWVSLEQSKTNDGLPARDPRWKCTIITTTRSWKLEELQLESQAIDRAVEIMGLQKDGTERLVKEVVSVLNSSTGKHKNVDEFINQCHQLVRRCMKVPLLLNTFVCLWYEVGRIDELLAGTYCGLVELLIKYAEGDARKRLFQKIPFKKLTKAKQTWIEERSIVPDFLLKRQLCTIYGPFLIRLGKIAFDNLFSHSRESTLVFDYQSITDVISEEELEIAVTTGLLSQTTHFGSVLDEQFSLSFLHKTLQEFLASLYMVSANGQSNACLDTYREYCTDAYKILEMENILMFVSGICPKMAGKMSCHIASLERNKEVHKLLLRCLRQESITSGTTKHIYIKHHFLYPSVQSCSDGLDYNAETISLLSKSNDENATLCLNGGADVDVLKCIADVPHVKLVKAAFQFTRDQYTMIAFPACISPKNSKLMQIDSISLHARFSGTYLEELEISCYNPLSKQCTLDLSACKSLQTLLYFRSAVPIQLSTEQLVSVIIYDYKPFNAPVLDLSGCKALKTVKYIKATVPLQLPTESLERVIVTDYTPSTNSTVLDLSGCKSLATLCYRRSTAPIKLPTEQLLRLEIAYYKPRSAVLDLSACKSLKGLWYERSSVPIVGLPTEQLEEVDIVRYSPRNAPLLDFSACKNLKSLSYKESTVPIHLSTESIVSLTIIDFNPNTTSAVLDLSECKYLKTVQYVKSTVQIQLPTESLVNMAITDYIPNTMPALLDLSECKSLRTFCCSRSTASIQLPNSLDTVVIYSYMPHDSTVLDLSACKSLRIVQYEKSTVHILLPTTGSLVSITISDYKPSTSVMLDLSGCISLRYLCYEESKVPIELPTEQLEEVRIIGYETCTASVLDLSGCKSLRTVKYVKSTIQIQLPTESLEMLWIKDYKPTTSPTVLDMSGCNSLSILHYNDSTAPIKLPTEKLEQVSIIGYKAISSTLLDFSGCSSLKCLCYDESIVPIQLSTNSLGSLRVINFKPNTAQEVMDLSGCKSLQIVHYVKSAVQIQLPTEVLEHVTLTDYKPDTVPNVLDLSGCKALKTFCYSKSTASIQLPTEQLDTVVIHDYRRHNVAVLDLSGCKSLRILQYVNSTAQIKPPTESLVSVTISNYKLSSSGAMLDLSGCKSLRHLCYEDSNVPIEIPTEQLNEVDITGYHLSTVPVLDFSACESVGSVYKNSIVPIQLSTQSSDSLTIIDYKANSGPAVLDLPGCKLLKWLCYKESTSLIQLPTENLEEAEITGYNPSDGPVLNLSGCQFLATFIYKNSTVLVQLPNRDMVEFIV